MDKEYKICKIAIPDVKGVILLEIDDIIYCQADQKYTEIVSKGGDKIVSSKGISVYTQILREHNFYRVNRSYLINPIQICSYIKGSGGTVVMSNGYEIDVPRRSKTKFLELLSKISKSLN